MRMSSLPLRFLLPSAWSKSSARGSSRRAMSRRRVPRPFSVLTVEYLEDRCLLTGATTWAELGPKPQLNPNGLNLPAGEATSGRVSALAFGTYNNQAALYLGSASGGVWHSTDFNTSAPTWTPLTDSGAPISTVDPTSGLGAGAIDVGSLLVSGTNLYVGTGEANASDSRYGTGLLKSINGGDAWTAKPDNAVARQTFFQHSVSKIVADPQTGNLYAAVVPPDLATTTVAGGGVDTNLGIWQSTDSGSTWAKVTGGTSGIADGAVVTDLEYTGSGATFRLYAAVGNRFGTPNPPGAPSNGVYIGTPVAGGGFTFTQQAVPTNGGRISLASDHMQTVYAAVGSLGGSNPLQSIRGTTNNGTRWSEVTPPRAMLV